MARNRTPDVASLWLFGGVILAGPVLAGQDEAAEPAKNDPVTSEAETAEGGMVAQDAAVNPLEPLGPVVDLDPLVVVATRTERASFDAPAIVDVVTRRDIDEAQYRSVPDIFREVPGVAVQKTGYGQGSPYIRGFTGFRNLLLIDGIRLNNSVFRDGPNQYWNTIDPFSIERIEIVKGPSSVLYGSDAIGGTVGVFSRGPFDVDSDGEGVTADGRAIVRLSTAERSFVGRGEIAVDSGSDFGVYGGGTYRNYGDLRSGSGVQPETGYREWDADSKIVFDLSESWALVGAYQAVHQYDAWRTHKTIHGFPYAGTTVGNELKRSLDQDRQLGYVQLRGMDFDGPLESAGLNVSWQLQSEERNRIRSDGRQDIQGFDVNTLGLWGQASFATDLGTLTTGFEYYRDWVSSYRRNYAANGSRQPDSIQGPVADDSTYDLFGVYLQDEIPFGRCFDLVIGGRWNWAQVDAGRVEDPVTGDVFSISENYSALVGSARGVVHLDDSRHWNFFGGVSQGFRAPNLSDLTRLDSARSNEIETPSPGLEPERFLAYETGLKASYDTLFAQGSWYWTTIENQIIRQPTGRIVQGDREVTKVNAGRGYVQGVDISATWNPHPNWKAFGSFSWVEGEGDTYPTADPVVVREPLSKLQATEGQVGLRWQTIDNAVWIEGVVTMVQAQRHLSSADRRDTQRIPPGGTPGYTVASLRGGWQATHALGITVTLDNLTNKNYRVHGSGVNESGFNAILGIEWRF